MNWWRRGWFLSSFVAARGIQFVAPVLAANMLRVPDYGAIEWAHATATLVAAVLTFGMAGVVPYTMLGAERRGSLPAVLLHQSALAVVALSVAAIAWPHGVGRWTLVPLFVGLLALQGTWTYILRARGHDAGSLFLEATPMTLVALAAALAAWLNLADALPTVAGALLAGLVALMVPSVIGCWHVREEARRRYVETLHIGVPLMIGGVLGLLATTSGRIGIGVLGNAEMTGVYAAIARIAALPIVAHQLAVAAKFRDMFELPPALMERLLVRICLFVFVAVLCLYIVSRVGAELFGPAFNAAAAESPVALVLLPAQAMLWSGVALNDLIATRHRVLQAVVPWSAAALIACFAIAFVVMPRTSVSVDRFAVWHTAAMATLFVGQSLSMAARSVRFMAYWATTVVCFLAAVAVGLVMLGT